MDKIYKYTCNARVLELCLILDLCVLAHPQYWTPLSFIPEPVSLTQVLQDIPPPPTTTTTNLFLHFPHPFYFSSFILLPVKEILSSLFFPFLSLTLNFPSLKTFPFFRHWFPVWFAHSPACTILSFYFWHPEDRGSRFLIIYLFVLGSCGQWWNIMTSSVLHLALLWVGMAV